MQVNNCSNCGEICKYFKCGRCKKQYDRKRYTENRERILIQTKKYSQTKAGREVMKKKIARQREKYPEKYKARKMLNNRLMSGKIIKKPCEVCNNKKVEAHHDDYSKPLDVRWLCKYHHLIVEGKSIYAGGFTQDTT